MLRRAVPFALTLAACSSPAPQSAAPAAAVGGTANATVADSGPTADERFADWATVFQAEHLSAHPHRGVELGLHEYDGRLPDVSEAGLAAEVKRLQAAVVAIESFEGLSVAREVERQVLLHEVRDWLFKMATWKQPTRNPMFYMDAIGLTPYISRDYAPLTQRAAAVAAMARAVPAYLADANTNLSIDIPQTWLETGIMQVEGNITFVREDVPAALSAVTGEAKTELDAALADMTKALERFRDVLKKRKGRVTQDHALGEERFLKMLRETQGVDVDLAKLKEVAEKDLARNLAALTEAAKKIDPKASVARVVARVAGSKPGDVLAEATDQATRMRAFLVEKNIVSIPFDDPAVLKESPPFMRWNAAFLDGAGAFETKQLPSFYYISPPDPKWSRKKQRQYLPGKPDLLFITIHEVWPGHFLHTLHLKKNESRVLKSFWNYTMGEGWAHYAEEMMWLQGASKDERDHVGQLLNALLRNVRFVSTIGIHTGGMTVAESTKLFREKAFQDPGNAEQQARRGTFDPMYLAYTIGKLMILKLRDDWIVKHDAADKPEALRTFHDEILSYGAAPVPVIRRAMLGQDAGPAL